MKNSRIFLGFFLSLGFLMFTACHQDNIEPSQEQNQVQEEMLSEEQAVEMISKSIAPETEGLSAEAEEAAVVTDAYAKSLNCGDSGDTTFVRSHEGPNVTASFTIHRNWELICEDGQPVALQLLREVEGGYEGPQFVAEGSSITNLEVTHLLSPHFVIVNGTREAQRTRTSVENPDFVVDTEMNMNFLDIKVSRAPHREILAGELVFVLEVTNSNGNTQIFEGNLIFLGNRTGVLTVNGHSRIISW